MRPPGDSGGSEGAHQSDFASPMVAKDAHAGAGARRRERSGGLAKGGEFETRGRQTGVTQEGDGVAR